LRLFLLLRQCRSASACNSLAKYYDASAAVKCGPTLGTLQESFGNSDLIPIPRLPGCNPVWGASGVKPTCNPPIAALDVSAFTGANDGNLADSADQLVFPLSTQPGWHDWFCVNGLKGVLGGGFTTDPALTRDSCQNSCLRGGYQYAGIGKQGSSWTCVCGHSIDYSTQIAEGMCTQPCPGNSSQTCGNTWIYQLSYAANGTAIDWSSSAMSDGTINMGCYSNPGNPALGLMGQQTYSYTSDSMTSAICIAACKGRNSSWAATFSGNTCYCGTNFIYGTGGFTESNLCTVKCRGNSSETCGDNYRMNVYNITAASANANGALHPAGWQGCYAEGSGHYALANHSWSSSAMTPMTCINGCNELGYAYAGLENGQFCFCGSQFQGGQSLPESSCSNPCSGNSSAVCGGQSTLDLYSMAAATVSLTSLPEVKLGNYMGCFVDSGSTTALTDYSYQTSTMTVPTCLQACTEFGYNYAGVENANVCKCGKTAPATTRVPTPINCVRACVGSSSQTCGAGGYLEVYNLTKSSSTVGLNLTKSASASSTSTSAASASGSPNATSDLFPSPSGSTSYLGCFADTTSNRALSAYSFTLTGMTVAMCQSGCNEMGYSLGGVENGNMCFCGSSFSSASHQQLPTSSCNVACSGSSTTTCGGSSAVAIYTATGAYNPATYPSGYIGCYTDSTARTLPGSYYSDWSMSSQQCRTACAASQFSIAGTESGGSCACGNSIATSGTKLPSAYCSTPCLVNVNETCGGNWRISVYNSTGAVVKANGIKGYAGCFNDYSALKGYSFSSDWMSTDICTRQCLAHGFAYAGLHASQCMCGNTSPIQLAADSNCASTCTAAPTESCGTSSAAAVYNVKNAGLTSGAFNLSPNSTGFAGCFTDSSSGRTLYSATFTSSTMTNDLCVANCKALGYAYAGTESATGCFCGNALNVTGTSYQVAAGNCATACQGGRGQVCGGSSRISIYDTSKYSSSSMTALPVVEGLKGCYGTGSFLTGSPYTYGSPWSTNELCRRTCRTKGYSIAGLTNGNTCGCANDTSLLGAQTAISACNVACNGNANQTCGGGFSALVSVFDTTGAGAQVPSGYPSDYVGCYADSSSSHVLSGATVTINSMSSTYCKSYCNSYGYGVSGTENGNVCYCGAALPTPLGLFPDSQCSTPCAGE